MALRHFGIAALAIATGCTASPVGSDGSTTPGTDTSPTDSVVDTDTDTSPTDTLVVETGDTGPPLVEFDCDTIPTLPTAFRELPGARGYHDVAFSPDGWIIGSDAQNSNLLRADSAGTTGVFVPNVGTVEQMAWLPDGDLAVATVGEGIVRITAAGARVPINANVRAYGLILGPDDQLYAADQSEILRVDPITGQADVLLPTGALEHGTPRVINFDLDHTRIYIGTLGGRNGKIYVADVDANLDIVSPPTVFATGVGTGGFHDTLGIDLCGYLYVADYNASSLYRISPQGDVQLLLESSNFLAREYGHGMEWGSGDHGWDDHAVYITQPYNGNTVTEVVIGVPSRHWTGGVAVNLP